MIEPADGFGMRMRQELRASLGLTSHLFNRAASRSRAFVGLALIAAVLVSPFDAAAQSGGDGFLFRSPRVTLSLHGGYAQARAGSDLFDEVTRFLTIEKRDFRGFTFGGDVGVRATDRLEIVLGLMYSRSGDRSNQCPTSISPCGPNADTIYVAPEDDTPLVQNTHLTRVPVTASLRFYLAPRGRTIGRFAWVPSTLVPYVGVGAGGMYHKFQQDGEFVDFVDETIFPETLESSGWSALAQVFGGFEIALGPRVAIMTEGRYLWSSADLGSDFSEDLEPIDLAGFQATAGLSFRL